MNKEYSNDELGSLIRKFAKLIDSKRSDKETMERLNSLALRIKAIRKKGG